MSIRAYSNCSVSNFEKFIKDILSNVNEEIPVTLKLYRNGSNEKTTLYFLLSNSGVECDFTNRIPDNHDCSKVEFSIKDGIEPIVIIEGTGKTLVTELDEVIDMFKGTCKRIYDSMPKKSVLDSMVNKAMEEHSFDISLVDFVSDFLKDYMGAYSVLTWKEYGDIIRKNATPLIEWVQDMKELSVPRYEVGLIYNVEDIVSSVEYKVVGDVSHYDDKKSEQAFENEFKYMVLLEDDMSTNYSVGYLSRLQKAREPFNMIKVTATHENLSSLKEELFDFSLAFEKLIVELFTKVN